MGRSVSTHRHSVATVYLNPEFDQDDARYEWDSFIEDLRENVLKPRYPSLSDCDRWLDREDHIVAENRQIEISVSEYCGCVAVCLAPLDPDNGFHVAVAERLAAGFQATVESAFKSCALRSLGSMSNGERVFQKID